MEKIKDYKIESAISTVELSRKVNQEINNGWQPYGDFKAVHVKIEERGKPESKIIFSQAMVKY